MKPETKFQKKVLSDLKKLSNVWILKTQERARKGVPDILLCCNGTFVALELKSSAKSKISPLQKFEINYIQACGGLGWIVHPDNWGQIYTRIKDISCQIKYNAFPS